MKMISSLQLKPNANFDFGKQIMVDKAVISQQVYNHNFQKFKAAFPNDSNEQINLKINNIILKEYVVGAIFDFLMTLFEFKIDKNELENNVNKFKTNTKRLSADKKENEAIIRYIERLIKQQLIINYFVENHNQNLYPTDDQAIETLQNYYKETNKSIRDLKSEQGLSVVKDTICLERFADWIRTKYEIKFKNDIQIDNQKTQSLGK